MSLTTHAFAHVEWDPERFGIGIRQIDDQHKHLISIINSLSTLVHEAYKTNEAQRNARAELNRTSLQQERDVQVEVLLRQAASPAPEEQGSFRYTAAAMGKGSGSRVGTPVNHSTTVFGAKSSSVTKNIHHSPQGPAGSALRTSVVSSPFPAGGNGLLSPRPTSTPGTGRGGVGGVPQLACPVSVPSTLKIAQGQPDLYTPASHLRSFSACYQKNSAVWECLGRLVSYSLRSLASEDNILETYAYADRATQMQEHEAFGEQVCRYHKLSEEYALEEEDLLHLLTFLKLWVREHIPRDRRYAPLLLEKGVGS